MSAWTARIDAASGFLLRHRGAVLAGIAVVTAFLLASALSLSFGTSPETILELGDSDLAALRDHERVLGSFEHRVLLVVEVEDVFAPEVLEKIGAAGRALEELPEVRGVRDLTRSGYPVPGPAADPDGFRRAVLGNRLLSPFLVSRSATTAAIHVELRADADGPRTREATVERVLRTARSAGLDPLVAGVPAVRIAYATFIRQDLLLLPPLVSSILFVLLYAAFRRWVAVLAPLAVVALAAAWTLGVLALTGGRITALTSILPSLILVVGVATGVHVVARFREARARGIDPVPAAREAMSAMVLPCGLTALTTAVGFSSLMVTRIRDVREFGAYAAVGALLAFLLGVPVIGILLSYDRARGVPDPGLRGARGLRRFAAVVIRRPRRGILAGVALAALAAIGITRLESNTFLLEDVREGAPIHRATTTVDRELGGVIGFDLVAESEDGLLAPESVRWFLDTEARLRDLPGVKAVVGPGTLFREAARSAGLEDAPLQAAPLILAAIEARGAGDVVRGLLAPGARLARIVVRTGDVGSSSSARIRERALEAASATTPEGVTVRVAGLTVLAEELLGKLVREMGRSTALAFVVIFLLMSLLFQSLRVGALSMVPNFLPLFAAAGFMGFAEITIRSSIALIFAVGLGIAVDDTVHLLIRYRRERRAGKGHRGAAARAVRFTGRPVVLTSAVLLSGFVAFSVSDFKATEQFGLISAVTIATALAGDLVLLPALIVVFRRGRRPVNRGSAPSP